MEYKTKRKKGRSHAIYLLAFLPFLVVAILFEVIPLLMIIFNSFMPEGSFGFTLEHYQAIFSRPLYQKAILNSIVISLLSSVIGIVIAFFGAMAAHSAGEGSRLRKAFLTVLNMTSNFAGVPLAFAYMILLGNSGLMVQFGKEFGIEFLANYNLYTSAGLRMIYVYFQVPLATLLMVPAFQGIRQEWQEASTLMGGGPLDFWHPGAAAQHSGHHQCAVCQRPGRLRHRLRPADEQLRPAAHQRIGDVCGRRHPAQGDGRRPVGGDDGPDGLRHHDQQLHRQAQL